jgi:hypothetical protein
MSSFAKIVQRRLKMNEWGRNNGGMILTRKTEVSRENPGPVLLFETPNLQKIFVIRIAF